MNFIKTMVMEILAVKSEVELIEFLFVIALLMIAISVILYVSYVMAKAGYGNLILNKKKWQPITLKILIAGGVIGCSLVAASIYFSTDYDSMRLQANLPFYFCVIGVILIPSGCCFLRGLTVE